MSPDGISYCDPDDAPEDDEASVMTEMLRRSQGLSDEALPGLPSAAEARTPRRVLSLAECVVRPDAAYVVKGIIRPRNVILLVGEPGAGKSLLAPLLGHRIGAGRTILGRRTRLTRVLYVACEAGDDMQERFAALREREGDSDLHLWPHPVNLTEPASGDAEELREVMLQLGAGVLILDTLPSAFPALRENDPDAMGAAVRVLRDLSHATGCAVVAVHHPAKGGETGRGHGLLTGDADALILVRGERHEDRTIIMKKNRNGTCAGTEGFSIETVDLGVDDDGDRILRPVASEAHREEQVREPKGKRLTDAQAGWLRELADLFATSAAVVVRPPKSGMDPVRCLSRGSLRSGLRGSGRFDLDSHGNLTAKDRDRLREALNQLKDKQKVGLSDDWVWLI
ncbi:AAA family ATPase [Muricoccus radiodurans]|uniref:AAA family ATPase n=1 Tax=Muricoccus radiodurans TaxID=2231721 RepID=UPI003CF01E6B